MTILLDKETIMNDFNNWTHSLDQDILIENIIEDLVNAYSVREQLLKIEKDGEYNIQENINELIKRNHLLLKSKEYQ